MNMREKDGNSDTNSLWAKISDSLLHLSIPIINTMHENDRYRG